MSQQINLLLPELRPRRDWLAFPLVSGAALAVLVVVAGLALWGRHQVQTLNEAQAQGEAELKTLQQRVQVLGQSLAARQPNPALQAEIEQLAESLRQRQDALRVVDTGKTGGAGGYAMLMRGFARQIVDGVWLTGFSAAGSDVEINGRLADAALLPQYIRRLNDESAFQGRRFASLDMKAVAADGPAGGAAAKPAPAAPRYTEFVLRGTPAKAEDKR